MEEALRLLEGFEGVETERNGILERKWRRDLVAEMVRCLLPEPLADHQKIGFHRPNSVAVGG